MSALRDPRAHGHSWAFARGLLCAQRVETDSLRSISAIRLAALVARPYSHPCRATPEEAWALGRQARRPAMPPCPHQALLEAYSCQSTILHRLILSHSTPQASALVTAAMPPPMALQFERVMSPFLLMHVNR